MRLMETCQNALHGIKKADVFEVCVGVEGGGGGVFTLHDLLGIR
jgi:hypothetical protein